MSPRRLSWAWPRSGSRPPPSSGENYTILGCRSALPAAPALNRLGTGARLDLGDSETTLAVAVHARAAVAGEGVEPVAAIGDLAQATELRRGQARHPGRSRGRALAHDQRRPDSQALAGAAALGQVIQAGRPLHGRQHLAERLSRDDLDDLYLLVRSRR